MYCIYAIPKTYGRIRGEPPSLAMAGGFRARGGEVDWTARQLRAVITVAERGNISHAAVQLELTQPTVSRILSRVEAELGATLFERDARGATPTEAGKRFIDKANEVLRSLDDVSDEIRSLGGRLFGKICVAMPDTIGHTLFIPLLDHFAANHGDVELRLMASHPNSIPPALAAGDADVAVVSGAHRQGRVIARALATEDLHLVGAGTGSFDSPPETISLTDVACLPLILPAIQPGLRALIDAAFAQRQLRPTVLYEVDAEDAIVELIGSGRGYSIMSFAGVQRFVYRGELSARRIVDPPIQRLLSTARPENRSSTRLMTAVEGAIQQLSNELRHEAQWQPWSQHGRGERVPETLPPGPRPVHVSSSTSSKATS